MAITLKIHRCKNLRVSSCCSTNANHISLEIETKTVQDGLETVEVSMFGLSEDVTDKLLEAFGDEDTNDYDRDRQEAA